MSDHKYSTCIEWAHALGSTATTHRGAVRFVRSALGPRTFPTGRRCCGTIKEWEDRRWSRVQMAPTTFGEWYRARQSRARLGRRADGIATALGIIWGQTDALALAERLTALDVARCHEAAKRRDAARTRQAMGRRTVRVVHHATDAEGRPLVLWFRRGEAHRRLTGWDDGRIWTTHVPLRLADAEEALAWLEPDGMPPDTVRQGEWFFAPVPSAEEKLLEEAWESGRAEDYEHTDAGSEHHTRYSRGTWHSRHQAQQCVVAEKSGCTAFIGHGGDVRTHDYTAHPRLYVRGTITAPDHPDLNLAGWHEVIGNRAVGAPAALAADLD